jgi:DNA repair exonuclease SbcCD ATPase subunit
MMIENIMYFALGLLFAGLLAVIIMPAVWKRAVRLTKKRIEAATPITLAEFRADKDQLRAEFALQTRRLETTIEGLRARLAEQVGEYNDRRAEFGAMRAERDSAVGKMSELEAREAALRDRVLELERETTDLAQQLRMRERELENRTAEIQALRDEYAQAALEQAALEEATLEEAESIEIAQARIAEAGSSLEAMAHTDGTMPPALAEELKLEDQLAGLQNRINAVEATIMADWDTERLDETALRAQLDAIAADTSRIVYAADTEPPQEEPPAAEESLFERIQRFADEREDTVAAPPPAPTPTASARRKGSVTDRMAALREIQGR